MNWGKCKPYLYMDECIPVIVLGPNFQLFLWAYIAYAIYGFIILILLYSRHLGFIRLSLSVVSYTSTLTNYFLAAFMNQGVSNYSYKYFIQPTKYCEICKQRQQKQTEHCDACGVCIEGHDHHCPWIGKCVGRHNKRYFYVFIFSMFVFQISSILMFTKIL
ncbi:unnamed protein product (macronuclear) [Paramecium tetraurelia]|uniref:Palmitoyltransferase n=1 Tax=Paramecium tetraurelia TaxID=5888 RepID=A0CLH2_PARTE|nr:uncharacterized protein GSPATT00008187001 [Paramecium tetraurelia]CAK71639.1 unnamed protein product [Paramecium tetraurelia]|eukprot:XP_001439036.1 hypothetical protein (macronuclear) [Paramecium tetraurelia strain d4-2]